MMLDNRIQNQLSGWEMPEDLNHGLPAEDAPESAEQAPYDLRTTIQLEQEALFSTARIEELLAELKWESMPQPLDFWYGEL